MAPVLEVVETLGSVASLEEVCYCECFFFGGGSGSWGGYTILG